MNQQFSLNDTEQKKLKQWLKKEPQKSDIAKDASINYTFTPTGIGVAITVKCNESEINVTDYESW